MGKQTGTTTTATTTAARTAVAIAWFLMSTAALVWPLFHRFGNYARPFVWGLPWSFVYVLSIVLANFAVLLLLYRWRWIDATEATDEEGRR